MQRIEIREIPDKSARAVGLDKHNRSKLPGTSHVVMARLGPDDRYITGIDERSITLNRIADDKLRKQETERRRKLRERLEQLLGKELDATSDFWESFSIDLSTTKVLHPGNPRDDMKLEFLLANLHVAPDENSATLPDFSHCKYYLYRRDISDSEKVNKTKTIDSAKAKWFEISGNEAKAKLYAAYCLGNKVSADYSADARYTMMSDHLGKFENALKFHDIVKLRPEQLQVKIIIDYALNRNVIRIREGYFQRGNATYGTSLEDVIQFFMDAANQNEFESLRHQLKEEYQFKL